MKAIKNAREQASRTEPTSLLDQLRQETKIGKSDWFTRRRKARPSAGRLKAAGGVVLPRKLLKRTKRITSLPSIIPDGAPIFPGAPRTMGLPTPKPLRRFSGARVFPANFTQIYNGESRSIYYDTSFPWVCIGRLGKPDGTWGTAALVGKNTILTASHVVSGWWSPGGPVTGSLIFVPAMFDGTSILGSDWTAKI